MKLQSFVLEQELEMKEQELRMKEEELKMKAEEHALKLEVLKAKLQFYKEKSNSCCDKSDSGLILTLQNVYSYKIWHSKRKIVQFCFVKIYFVIFQFTYQLATLTILYIAIPSM